ncbi:hypothetical protein EB796_025015 [Bugula neritina]|uniref:Uncharacterized protein n=1 Tax=Bugula neritina TaxID=10212 RepID=A0A7J7ITD8_BUGNE|nr:hypothetical protein EB796_025015 [Bugula neritina]
MHSHSGALQPRAMPANMPHPQGQQQHVVSMNAPTNFRPNPKVEYSAQNVPVVKWLTITQLVLACIIFVLHAATTAMNDHFNTVAAPIEDQLNYLYWSFSDEAATGVWVGIVMIVAAVIGIQAYKTQRKGLIITHLVFNIFLMMFCCTLIGTISATIAQLNNCRHFGEYYEFLSSGAYYTTTGKPLYLFGEQLTPPHGNFYCSHVSFSCQLLPPQELGY